VLRGREEARKMYMEDIAVFANLCKSGGGGHVSSSQAAFEPHDTQTIPTRSDQQVIEILCNCM
jgi:hypothetical protein